MNLRDRVIRLAYEKPELRERLLPILKKVVSSYPGVPSFLRSKSFLNSAMSSAGKVLGMPGSLQFDHQLGKYVYDFGGLYLASVGVREDLSLYGYVTSTDGSRTAYLEFSGPKHPKWKGSLDVTGLSERRVQSLLSKAVVKAIKSLPAPRALTEPEVDWSVAQRGPDGYVDYVEVFGSKSDAERHARGLGDAYVMRGTQMWNEPLGQIEESNRPAKYRYFR